MAPTDRRSVLKSIGAGTALLVGGVGAAGASPGGRGPPSQRGTIVDVAVGAEGFNVLVAAVKRAGLVDALSGNRQLTVFAPTDQAFIDLLAGLEGVDDLDDIPVDTLRSILTYHVAPGRRDAESVVTSDEIPTLNGALIEVDGTDLNSDQADIVATNIEASNGIIHVIDGVLLP